MSDKKFGIIVPCYNEEEALPSTIETLKKVLEDLIRKDKVSKESFLFFVDDGSKDKTWEIIKNSAKGSLINIKGVSFTRNYGNQFAILAGLNETNKLNADMVVTIDADLQQDVNKIEEFIGEYEKGYDIVAGVRNDRKTDGLIKKTFSNAFYYLMNFLGVRLKPNHSEYRLISKKTLNIISHYKERNIFLRGLFMELGLKTKYVNFDVKARQLGKSKFSFASLLKLAAAGIVSFSVYPLRLVFLVGVVISLSCFIIAFLILLEQILNVNLFYEIEFFKVWITFISGIQILCVGIIGEYIGEILSEIKNRPQYIIDKEV